MPPALPSLWDLLLWSLAEPLDVLQGPTLAVFGISCALGAWSWSARRSCPGRWTLGPLIGVLWGLVGLWGSAGHGEKICTHPLALLTSLSALQLAVACSGAILCLGACRTAPIQPGQARGLLLGAVAALCAVFGLEAARTALWTSWVVDPEVGRRTVPFALASLSAIPACGAWLLRARGPQRRWLAAGLAVLVLAAMIAAGCVACQLQHEARIHAPDQVSALSDATRGGAARSAGDR